VRDLVTVIMSRNRQGGHAQGSKHREQGSIRDCKCHGKRWESCRVRPKTLASCRCKGPGDHGFREADARPGACISSFQRRRCRPRATQRAPQEEHVSKDCTARKPSIANTPEQECRPVRTGGGQYRVAEECRPPKKRSRSFRYFQGNAIVKRQRHHTTRRAVPAHFRYYRYRSASRVSCFV
jgi:hypothetical protein